MKNVASIENAFRFKGIHWTYKTFSDVLQTVLTLHRTISNHRVAFHFGVSEKAVRMLRLRSQIADRVILQLIDKAKLIKDKPAQYCERDRYHTPQADSQARKILNAAEAERHRQWEIRYTQRKLKYRRVTDSASKTVRLVSSRREAVQRCKQSGLTQVLAAERLSCSVRTVRRYW